MPERIFCSAFATIQNKQNASLFGRCISTESIRKAVAVVMMFLSICLASTLLLMIASPEANVLDVVYETVSATATVGLTRNFTGQLTGFGKLIIIFTMYFGRIGPISLAVALGSRQKSQNIISEPTEEISIG